LLSPLQEQVAGIIAGLDEATDFALAGGAALIVRGDVDRQTRDLDFFGLTTDAVDRLVPAVERALRAVGLTVRRVQDDRGFARLLVEGEDGRTEVDLAADARLFPAEPGALVPTLSGEELAVDKVLAVFGRAEARDFVDLLAVQTQYSLDRLCELATEKDRGFTPEVFAEMLGQFRRLRREEFDIGDAGFGLLTREVERWREYAIGLSDQRKHGQS
jgi:Nucleotidyl transferase AbiEii toxin, Type IV TA system